MCHFKAQNDRVIHILTLILKILLIMQTECFIRMQLNRAFARIEAQFYPQEKERKRDFRSMGQSKGYCPPSKSKYVHVQNFMPLLHEIIIISSQELLKKFCTNCISHYHVDLDMSQIFIHIKSSRILIMIAVFPVFLFRGVSMSFTLYINIQKSFLYQ